MRPSPRRPPRLQPGDTVAVVAPAGPVPRAGLLAGLARLGDRYRLRYDEAVFSRTGFLAGDDRRRLDELHRALGDPTVRAVLCARGGYGIMRLLPELVLGEPKLVVGFSDVTALHGALLRHGQASLHGPTLTHLGVLDEGHAAAYLAALESPTPPPPWAGLGGLVPGVASGLAIGGNLELVTRLLATPWALPLDGNVLFLEDVGERPYRLDRALTQLELAGARRLAAVVVGELVSCEAADGAGPCADEVVAERLARLGVPVVTGAPFGHGTRNLPFPHGVPVTVDATRGEVTFLDGAVA